MTTPSDARPEALWPSQPKRSSKSVAVASSLALPGAWATDHHDLLVCSPHPHLGDAGLVHRWTRTWAFFPPAVVYGRPTTSQDRKSTRLNSSHLVISYAVFCLKKKKKTKKYHSQIKTINKTHKQ